MGHVHEVRGLHEQGAHRLNVSVRGEQHPAHVQVLDDRYLGCAVFLHARPVAALQPCARVVEGGLVGSRRERGALQPHLNACRVHHVEHQLHAGLLFAEQEPLAPVVAAEDQGAGRRAVNAELLLEARADDVVRLPERAVGVDSYLRNDEEGQSRSPVRRTRSAGQHRVNDVLGEVVIARRDEDLLALDQVATVGLPDGAGLGCPNVGACLGLGEAHRACPLPGVHALAKESAHLVGTELLDQV